MSPAPVSATASVHERARAPAAGGLAAGDAGADAGAVAASVCSRGPTGAPAVGGRGGGGRAGGGSAGGAGGSPRASPRTSPRASPPAVASPHSAMVRLRPRSHSARGDFPGATRVGSEGGGCGFWKEEGEGRSASSSRPPSLGGGAGSGRPGAPERGKGPGSGRWGCASGSAARPSPSRPPCPSPPAPGTLGGGARSLAENGRCPGRPAHRRRRSPGTALRRPPLGGGRGCACACARAEASRRSGRRSRVLGCSGGESPRDFSGS